MKSKRLYLITIIIIAISWIIIGITVSSNKSDSNSSSTSNANSGFTIESFKLQADIQENNVAKITEIITVNWYNTNHHGIIRTLPQWLKYTSQSGKTEKRKYALSDIGVSETYTYSVATNDKCSLQIGSENLYVSEGIHTYTIFYNYNMGEDPYGDYDEFILHAFGDYWSTSINNASIEITMPKEFNDEDINFWNDKYREENLNDEITYYTYDNTLYAYADQLNNSLTIDILLPDGYFVNTESVYGTISLKLCITILVITIIIFFIWFFFGRDFEKYVNAIEYYPPENLDPAEIGYIYGSTLKKSTIGLIISLANKGYLKINDDDEQGIVLVKCENASKSMLSETENILYTELFKTTDTIILKEEKGFPSIITKIAKNLKERLEKKFFDTRANKLMIFSCFLSVCSMILWFIAYSLIQDLSPKLNWLYGISFTAILVQLFLVYLTTRPTKEGEKMSARIQGFKLYLKTAEKSRIEALVEENPSYFYSILPYAYVLDVSKTWIKKFEDMPKVDAGLGTFNYSDFHSLSTFNNSMHASNSSGGSGGRRRRLWRWLWRMPEEVAHGKRFYFTMAFKRSLQFKM